MTTLSTRYRHVQGMGELAALLAGYPRAVREKILVAGVRESAKPLQLAQKRNARRSIRTGALYASIKSKVKNYKDRGNAVAVVGPDRGYYIGHSAVKISRKTAKAIGAAGRRGLGLERPALYAHLVEYGHHVVPRGGGSGRAGAAGGTTFVAARPFVRPAVMSSRGAMANAFDASVTAGLQRAHARLKSGAKT